MQARQQKITILEMVWCSVTANKRKIPFVEFWTLNIFVIRLKLRHGAIRKPFLIVLSKNGKKMENYRHLTTTRERISTRRCLFSLICDPTIDASSSCSMEYSCYEALKISLIFNTPRISRSFCKQWQKSVANGNEKLRKVAEREKEIKWKELHKSIKRQATRKKKFRFSTNRNDFRANKNQNETMRHFYSILAEHSTNNNPFFALTSFCYPRFLLVLKACFI